MNMNMKNEKTMLALIVVAALAMVSVAGVALASDQSDAASTVLVNNNQLIDADVENANFNVYVPFTAGGDIIGGEFTITITSDADYTGTIQFGTWNVQTNAYNAAITLNLENVSSAKITFKTTTTTTIGGVVDETAVIETIQDANTVASTTGNITVSAGSLKLGDSNYFSGTVNADNATLASENTKGTVISSMGKITGTVTPGAQQHLATYYASQSATSTTTGYKTVDPKLTVYGTATLGDFTIGESAKTYAGLVEFIIDEDASISLTADAADYYIDSTFKVQVAPTADPGSYYVNGVVYDSLGQIVAYANGSDDYSNGYVTFSVKSGQILDVTNSKSYVLDLVVVSDSASKAYYYLGSATFSTMETVGYTGADENHTTKVSLAYTTLTVNYNTTPSVAILNTDSLKAGDKDLAGKMTISPSANSSTLLYNSSKYSLVAAFSISAEDGMINGFDCDCDCETVKIYNSALTSTGTITFDKANSSDFKLVVLLKNKTNNSYVSYAGDVSSTGVLGAYNSGYVTAIQPVTSTVSNVGEILSGSAVASTQKGDVYKSSSATDDTKLYTPAMSGANLKGFGLDLTNTLTITAAGDTIENEGVTYNNTVTINGTLNSYYVSTTSKGEIVNNGIVSVNDSLTYQIAKSSSVNTSAITGTGTINGIMYKTAATTNQNYDTYTYTTLDTAISAAANLYAYGTTAILKDTELTGTPVGTVTSQNVFTVLGKIVIGQKSASAIKETAAFPGIDAKEAITAIVTVPTTTKLIMSTGSADVKNGQLKITGLTVDSYNVTADVFMTDDEHGIYTDLATALSISVDGDTVNVRSGVTEMTLSKDATLSSGVILNGSGKDIIVSSGVIFTVNGIIKIDHITVKSATTTKDAGTLLIDNYDKDTSISTIYLSGIATIGTNFDNSSESDTIFSTNLIIKGTSTAYPAEFNVLGNLRYGGDISAQQTGTSTSQPEAADGATINGTISGQMTFSGSFDGSLVDVKFVCDVPGTLTTSAVFWVSEATVTGSVIIKTDGAFNVKTSLIVGVPSTDINATNDNSAKVTANLQSGTYAFVYGTPTNSKNIIIQDNDGTQINTNTVYYLNTDVIFATGYANGSVSVSKIADPVITGMSFYGWYKNAVLTTEVETSDCLGVCEKVYGKLQIQTTSVTLGVAQNGTWVINDVSYGSSGVVDVPYSSSYGIQVLPANGYELSSDFQVLVNGKAVPVGYVPSAGDLISFSGSINEKEEPAPGTDLVTILLVIITIVIVIMAIIIALKLMRS